MIRKELQRQVVMGPFKSELMPDQSYSMKSKKCAADVEVIQDDGMENRKTAYETMYTMVSPKLVDVRKHFKPHLIV